MDLIDRSFVIFKESDNRHYKATVKCLIDTDGGPMFECILGDNDRHTLLMNEAALRTLPEQCNGFWAFDKIIMHNKQRNCLVQWSNNEITEENLESLFEDDPEYVRTYVLNHCQYNEPGWEQLRSLINQVYPGTFD